MATAEQLIKEVESLDLTKYIKKNEKEFIKDNLEYLKQYVSPNEKKKLEPMIEILSKPKLLKADKDKINSSRNTVINIIKEYKEEFNEEDNEDDVNNNLEVNEIEKNLDNKVAKYNKYNKNHPMKGVTYNENDKNYRIRYKDYDNNTTKLNTACEKIKEKITPKNEEKILKNGDKNKFAYKDHYFIVYWHESKPYFDIQHMISVLNLKPSYIKQKYNEFSKNIKYYIWHKNQFGGYILRELINEKTMYDLILSSNSKFSKSYKSDVSEILVELRKNNGLVITNEKMTLKKPIKEEYQNIQALNYMQNIKNKQYKIYNYMSHNDLSLLEMLIKEGANISLSKYIGKHVLYMFVIPIKTEHNDIIIKIGYTEDIIDRIRTLKVEYKTTVFLIRIKIITGKKDESKFHKSMVKLYPQLVEKYKIKNKNKVELYKMSDKILKEYDNYMTDETIIKEDDDPEDLTEAEEEVIETVKQQDKEFKHHINNYKAIVPYNNKNNNAYYEYLTNKDNILHEKWKKEKEIEILKMQNKAKSDHLDKEIKLAQIKKDTAKIENDNITKKLKRIERIKNTKKINRHKNNIKQIKKPKNTSPNVVKI